MQRKQRYDRWIRRRSLEKINHILNKVRYEKAMYVQAREGGREGEGGRASLMDDDFDAHTPHQHSSFCPLALNSAKSANPQLAAIFDGKAAAQAAEVSDEEASRISE